MRRSQPNIEKPMGISDINQRADSAVKERDLSPKIYNTVSTKFTIEFVQEFLERIASGESVRSIGRREHMPSEMTIRKYLRDTPDFKEAYLRAKQIAADIMAEEILDIADDTSNDLIHYIDKDGVPQVKSNPAALKRAELQIRTRQWILARLKPEEYSEKYIAQDNSNVKGLNMSGAQIQIILPDNGRTINVE